MISDKYKIKIKDHAKIKSFTVDLLLFSLIVLASFHTIRIFLAHLYEIQGECSHPGHPRSRSRHTAVKFFKCLNLCSHSTQSIHIWNIDTWEGLLRFHENRSLGSHPRVRLEVKIKDTFVKCSIAVFKFFIYFYLIVSCQHEAFIFGTWVPGRVV